jgi:hypothetical protein
MRNFKISIYYLSLVFTSFSGAQVAQYFEGRWDCEVPDHHLNFQWEAHLTMEGHWLSGKTTKQGVLLSTDFWRIEKNGQPTIRRVFLADGSFVETDTQGWRHKKIKATGQLFEKKSITEVRETIRFKTEDHFEAISEQKKNEIWTLRSKEICTRTKIEKASN